MDKLLQILSDGEFHSGEELGHALGISRTAIWKQIQKVADLGLSVTSQKGCGYRLEGGLDLLNAERLSGCLSAQAKSLCRELRVASSVMSTNELAKGCAEEGDASGLVILAEQQTAGRGRRGRQWVSPFGANIYLSVAWSFDGGVQAIEGLSLAVGVAARRAIARCGVEGVELKWPNDLLWENKKIGGILLEIVGDPTGFCQVIVGLGVNYGMPAQYASDIDQAWTDLFHLLPQQVGRNELAACLMEELLLLLDGYHELGFPHYRDEWLRYDAYGGQPVKLLLMKEQKVGVARGVTDTGALILEIDGELQTFSGGEISVRSVE